MKQRNPDHITIGRERNSALCLGCSHAVTVPWYSEAGFDAVVTAFVEGHKDCGAVTRTAEALTVAR